MNTFFVLLVLFIPPSGELRIAFDQEQFATLGECLQQSEDRTPIWKKKTLWFTSSCVEIPTNPAGLPS
jgi:hypothetical protein